MIKFDPLKRKIEIGVHDLIDAGPSTGDLQLQLAWRAKTRMKEGQKIHQEYQALRAKQDQHFQAEVLVRYDLIFRNWEVRISGRIDGYTQEGDVLVVEEIKSCVLQNDQLQQLTKQQISSWIIQLELYLHFLISQGKDVVGRLVVISVLDRREKVFIHTPNPNIGEYITKQVQWIVDQYESREEWLRIRFQSSKQGVPFPHEEFRLGQKELIDSLVPELEAKKHVFLSAPTGSGKTASALYAALVHAYEHNLRVFFATARTTQQLMAEDTVEKMAQRGMPIRAVSIRAKEKICLHHEVRCHAESCPYAAGYFDKLQRNNTLQSAWREHNNRGDLWPDKIIRIAEEQKVCPHALSVDLASMADLVIGDFNYLFDPSVRLSLVSSEPSKWIIIVDEAHNLPERAMGYGSPRIPLRSVWLAAQGTQQTKFEKPVSDIYDFMLNQLAALPDQEWAVELSKFDVSSFPKWVDAFEELAIRYAQENEEKEFFSAEEGDMWTAVARTIFRFSAILSTAKEETLVMFHKGFLDRTLQATSQMSLFSPWKPKDESTSISLLNRDPSLILGPIFAGFHSSIIMSATLEPMEYYRNMFGISSVDSVEIRHPSFFPSEFQKTYIVPSISTAFKDREKDRTKTAEIISQIIANTPGNMAVFFSSFAFLEQVMPHVSRQNRPMLIQKKGITELERYEYLETMKRAEGHVLCAVMGGIFSEGVDLPNEALCCAVMVGPCLPQASFARKKIQEWNEMRYQKGYAYAWLVPGMARVAQAAGRVIRTPFDKGTIVLLGRRFVSQSMLELLPVDCKPLITRDIGMELRSFWDMHRGN